MRIDVTSIGGPLPHARCALAKHMVKGALDRFGQRILKVRFYVPAPEDRGATRTCSLFVLLDDGVVLERRAVRTNVADALERATHDMRRAVAAELGVPLCERVRDEISGPQAERRAS
jgi:hypothetical protein